jgi:hypothetical protein
MEVDMFNHLRGGRVTAVLVAITVLAVAAAGSWALAAGGSPVINACANKKSGALRLRGPKCKKSEKTVSWSVKGPQGANGSKGPTGPTGTTGSQGPMGPSDAFSRYNDGPPAFTANTSLAHINLSAGSYVIVGKLWLTNNSNTMPVLMNCVVTAGADSDTTRVSLMQNGANSAYAQALAFNVVHSSMASFVADLSCNPFGVSVSASNVKLTAIRVGSLSNASM